MRSVALFGMVVLGIVLWLHVLNYFLELMR